MSLGAISWRGSSPITPYHWLQRQWPDSPNCLFGRDVFCPMSVFGWHLPSSKQCRYRCGDPGYCMNVFKAIKKRTHIVTLIWIWTYWPVSNFTLQRWWVDLEEFHPLRASERNRSTNLLVCWLIYIVAAAGTYLDILRLLGFEWMQRSGSIQDNSFFFATLKVSSALKLANLWPTLARWYESMISKIWPWIRFPWIAKER